MKPLTDIQRVFLLSSLYGSQNHQDELPVNVIEWPKDTWLSDRRKKLAAKENQ